MLLLARVLLLVSPRARTYLIAIVAWLLRVKQLNRCDGCDVDVLLVLHALILSYCSDISSTGTAMVHVTTTIEWTVATVQVAMLSQFSIYLCGSPCNQRVAVMVVLDDTEEISEVECHGLCPFCWLR